jgi:uncharacterized protein (TIGR02391 family)
MARFWRLLLVMNRWYLAVRRLLREMHGKILDAQTAWNNKDTGAAETIHGYLRKDYVRLRELWNEEMEGDIPSNLGRHISWGKANDVEDMLRGDLPELDEYLDELLEKEAGEVGDDGFLHLLHSAVIAGSLRQFQDGHFRDAVLNSVVAIFDLIRERTGLDLDGSALVNRALSVGDPYLILSELTTESGLNDQKGFIQIFSGSYQGIRNPKAHSLTNDLTKDKASQYLVHASLLARRVSEAQVVKREPRISDTAPAEKSATNLSSRDL